MIQDDYVTFEQSKLLKEKGFPEDDYGPHYKKNGEIENGFTDLGLGIYYCPTLSLVQKWLREEKNIDIDISCNKGVTYKYYDCYIHEIADFICDKEDNPIKFNTYEEALSFGIDKALEVL